PDDYAKVLRMGIEQLVNGDFETQDGWTSQPPGQQVLCSAPAQNGQLSLQLEAGKLITQRVQRRVVPSATYLLEFYYRVEDEKTKVVAGVMVSGTAGGVATNDTKDSLTA